MKIMFTMPNSRSSVEEFEQCHKRSKFWKTTVNLSQNPLQCLHICMRFPCQNVFPSYFLSLWQVLSFFRALVSVSQQMYREHKRYSLRWTCCLLICCFHQARERCCQNSVHSILMGIVYERSKKKLY